MTRERDEIKVYFTTPEDRTFYRRIMNLARENNRSLSGQVLYMLKQALKEKTER